MSTDQLNELAEQHGIVDSFTDNFGHQQHTEADVKRAILQAIGALSAEPARDTQALRSIVVTLGEQVEIPIQPSQFADPGCEADHDQPLPSVGKTATCSYVIETEQGESIPGETQLLFTQATDNGGRAKAFITLHLPAELTVGYHQLQLAASPPILPNPLSLQLILVPEKAFCVDDSYKPVGVSVQLYSLRSGNNWGIGDFSDLAELCAQLGKLGVDTIGINPLHALYSQHPERCSPYSPASRVFLNPLYIDVMAAPGASGSQSLQQFIQTEDFRKRLQQARNVEQVDYSQVARLKLHALRLLFDSSYATSTTDKTSPTDSSPGSSVSPQQRFRDFVTRQGEALQLHACFEAFDSYFSTEHELLGWTDWPVDFHDPSTPQCEALAEQLADEIGFSCFLQWLADEQLAAVAQHAKACGLHYGLYMDLAVGVDRQGGEVWASTEQFARGIHIGAPPDALGPLGQDWSLTPFNPATLKNSGYAAFIQVLRANMRFAGILRIDHVMGLARQYWCVPALRRESGLAPGAYVNFPLDDLLGLVALESQRNQCVVVGEDLGTVPAGFREKLKQRGIYGYRVLYFEKDDKGDFHHPKHYEKAALATASTHDLPTLAGFVNRWDISLRMALGHIQAGAPSSASLLLRQQELDSLLQLLVALDNDTEDCKKWLSQFELPDAGNTVKEGALQSPESRVETLPATSEFVSSVHRLLAKTGSAILVLQLEDLLQQLEMANLPGTIDEHPNWKRKLPVTVDMLRQHLQLDETLVDVVQLRKAG